MADRKLDPQKQSQLRKLKIQKLVALITGLILTILMLNGYYNNNNALFWYAFSANCVILYLIHRIQTKLEPQHRSHFQFHFQVEKNFHTGSKDRDALIKKYLAESKTLEQQYQHNEQLIQQTQHQLDHTNDEQQHQRMTEKLKQLQLKKQQLLKTNHELVDKIKKL